MYGINRRDRYKNSKWSQKSKSELDITSESEYEDSKTEKSYSEKTEKIDKPIFNDLKIIESLNEIKETSKNKLDKVDNLLEYSKSIDSDAKNTFELLKTIESKVNTDHIELKTLIGNLSNEEENPSLLQSLNNNHNKLRIKLDPIPMKLDILHGDVEILYSKLDYVNQQQSVMVNALNKLIAENMYLKMCIIDSSKKIDQLIQLKNIIEIKEIKEEVKEEVKEEKEEEEEKEIKEEIEEIEEIIDEANEIKEEENENEEKEDENFIVEMEKIIDEPIESFIKTSNGKKVIRKAKK